MSSILRQQRGLKSAISILLSEGVGSNTHILSARRRTTPPCPLRRGRGFVQSSDSNKLGKTLGRSAMKIITYALSSVALAATLSVAQASDVPDALSVEW